MVGDASRDTDTAVSVKMWAPGTLARSLYLGSVETMVYVMEPTFVS